MALNSQIIQEQIKLGIKTYKAGDPATARLHFQRALREDTENISALLWLAYVISDPDKQIFLLERILQIDPENKRAKQGLQWVKQKMIAAQQKEFAAKNEANDQQTFQSEIKSNEIKSNETNDVDKVSNTEEFDEDEPSLAELKTKLNSQNLKKRAKKGTIAQRARRRINPLMMILISSLVAVGMLLGWLLLDNSQVSLAALASTPTPTVTLTATSSPTPLPSPTFTPTATPEATKTPLPPTHTATVVISSSTTIAPLPIATGPLAHQPATADEKWIEVDVSTQRVTAWEGKTAIMSFIVSTGLANTPTVLGKFRIYQKLTSTTMSGVGYSLPNVPHTMYFYQGYGLHGAYWHNDFGQPMSHGCVNLSLPDAETLFNWADPAIPEGSWYAYANNKNPGTLVVVHQ